MKLFISIITSILCLSSPFAYAVKPQVADLSKVISKTEFSSYKDVADFIDSSPKVTILVPPDKNDIDEYGQQVLKSLTGSDCDRDGKMDDNALCNAVYYKLWLKYQR